MLPFFVAATLQTDYCKTQKQKREIPAIISKWKLTTPSSLPDPFQVLACYISVVLRKMPLPFLLVSQIPSAHFGHVKVR
jgi:hypothetical protein